VPFSAETVLPYFDAADVATVYDAIRWFFPDRYSRRDPVGDLICCEVQFCAAAAACGHFQSARQDA